MWSFKSLFRYYKNIYGLVRRWISRILNPYKVISQRALVVSEYKFRRYLIVALSTTCHNWKMCIKSQFFCLVPYLYFFIPRIILMSATKHNIQNIISEQDIIKESECENFKHALPRKKQLLPSYEVNIKLSTHERLLLFRLKPQVNQPSLVCHNFGCSPQMKEIMVYYSQWITMYF